jgi:hypothetical protein
MGRKNFSIVSLRDRHRGLLLRDTQRVENGTAEARRQPVHDTDRDTPDGVVGDELEGGPVLGFGEHQGAVGIRRSKESSVMASGASA